MSLETLRSVIDLSRANARLREGFLAYEMLCVEGADPVTIARAGREVDRLADSLRILSELVDGA